MMQARRPLIVFLFLFIFTSSFSYSQTDTTDRDVDANSDSKLKVDTVEISGESDFWPYTNYTQGIPPSDLYKADIDVFHSIYDDSTDFKTSLAKHFDNSVLPVTIVLPVGVFAYSRAYDKTFDENTGYLLAVSELMTMGVTFGLKELVRRPRPYNSLKNVRQKDMSTHDPYSFPSGHSSLSFSIATMFTLRYPKYPQVYAPMYVWAVVTAWGRPYLGMHYPSDILAGALFGAGSSALIFSLRKELLKFKNSVLHEDRTDDGSINSGILSLFAGTFLLSDLLNTYLFKNNKIQLGIGTFEHSGSFLEVKYKF